MSNKRFSKLQMIILQVLKEMDSKENERGILHMRWVVQGEVCKRYMEHFGIVGYDPEKMSDNIKDHPEWEDNPKWKYFFIVEHGTDLNGKPYVYLKDNYSFTEAFFSGIINLSRKGFVKIERTYQRNKAGCCGYSDTKHEDPPDEPRQLKDIQLIKLAEGVC